jgi:pimeloyl-ACP methyl ester carboxylesterase
MTPLALRLLGSAASTVDRAAVLAFGMGNRRARAVVASLSHEEKLARLAHVRDAYGAPQLFADADAYFVPPPRLVPRQRRVRKLSGGAECLELSWESAFEPYYARVRDKYLANAHNRTAYARLYAGDRGSRPAVIVVHGYMAGQWAFEERVWPIRWMNARGLDVAIAILPFHAVRAQPGGGAPPFPGNDPRFANEGFRQTVADLRVLAAVLRERGAPSVGVMGMSLGGYSASLLATVQRDLAFVVPMIPLASIADSARDQGRLGRGERADELHAALEAAHRVVSPFARPSLVPKERVLVVGAEADRVTPIFHAERLAKHFDTPLLRLPGGHLLQTWRAPAFRAVKAMLRQNAIV